MLTVDTSALFAILNEQDPYHAVVLKERNADRGLYYVPAGILSELTYLIERDLGLKVLDGFLQDLQSGAYPLDCGEGDFGRIRQLTARYADLPLGFADSSVIACAERHGGGVLAIDHHFQVVAREGTIVVMPVSGPAPL